MDGKKKRKAMQKKVERYMKDREDLQLAGRIPVVPEGAVRDETVNSMSQETQQLPHIDAEAIKRGWATRPEKRPEVIDRLTDTVLNPETKPRTAVMAAQALMKADEIQWARDNPQEPATKININGENVQVQVIDPFALYKKSLEEAERVINVAGTQAGVGTCEPVLAAHQALQQASGDDRGGDIQPRDGGDGREQVG
jgi:hypothetical protein